MRNTLLVIGVTVLGLIGIVGSPFDNRLLTLRRSVQTEQQSSNEGGLRQYAHEAKRAGRTRVSIPAPEVDYPGASLSTTLESVLPMFSVVVATPTEKKTEMYSDDKIVTWHKFKIVELLSEQTEKECHACPSGIYPETFGRLVEDEFIIAQYGGTAVIDGVEVTMEYGYPPFQTGSNYLLIVARDASRQGVIVGGPRGAFALSDAGELKPLSKTPHPIIQAIRERYNNSIGKLRVGLKAIPKNN